MFRRSSRAKKEEAEAAAAAAAAAAGYRPSPPVESPPPRSLNDSQASAGSVASGSKKEKTKSKKWLKSVKKKGGGGAAEADPPASPAAPHVSAPPSGFGTLDRRGSLSGVPSAPIAIPQQVGPPPPPMGSSGPASAAASPPPVVGTPPSDKAPKRNGRWGRSSKRQAPSASDAASPTASSPSQTPDVDSAEAGGDGAHTTVKGTYHGVVEVVSPRGGEVVVRAVAQARLLEPSGAKVMVVVRATDLLVVSRKKGEIICNVPLSSVTYCTVDPSDSKAAAFIAPSRTGKLLCYVFVMKSKAADFPAAVTDAQTRLRGALALQQQRAQAAQRASMARSPGVARRGSVASAMPAGPPPSRAHAAGAAAAPPAGRPPLNRSHSAAVDAHGGPGHGVGRTHSVSRSPGSVRRTPSISQAGGPMHLSNGHAFGLPSRGLHFHGFYMGHEQVSAISGKGVCRDAFVRNAERLRRQGNANGDPVNVIVTHHSIKTVDRRSNETISGDFLRNVAFTCVAHAELEFEIFTYISQNERLGRTVCHVFRVPPRAGDSMCHAIGEVGGWGISRGGC